MNADIAYHLQRLEEDLLQPHIRRDPQLVASYLADDFREFGASGRIYNREQILTELAAETSFQPPAILDFAVQATGPNWALVTFRTVRQSGAAPRIVLRSSLWVQSDTGWRVLFHQGTKLP
jgi:hypothetical protein